MAPPAPVLFARLTQLLKHNMGTWSANNATRPRHFGSAPCAGRASLEPQRLVHVTAGMEGVLAFWHQLCLRMDFDAVVVLFGFAQSTVITVSSMYLSLARPMSQQRECLIVRDCQSCGSG